MEWTLGKISSAVETRQDKPLHIPLGNNLYLKIPRTKHTVTKKKKIKTNSATFYFRYTFGKTRKTKTLGLYSNEAEEGFLTIGQAMDITADYQRQLLNGHDPALKTSTQKKHITVDDVAEKFLANKETKIETIKTPTRLLKKEVSPKIGGLRIDKVKPYHILDIIEEVAASNRPTIANDVLGLLNQLFRYAVKGGYIDTIPSAAFTIRDAGGTEKPRKRNLSIAEVEMTFKVFRENIVTFQRTNYLAFAILLLTGVRKSELIKARWSEFNFKKRVWTIPLKRTKTRENDHVVPIVSELEVWLNELKIMSGTSCYVFPKRKFQRKRGASDIDTSDTHISEDTLNSALATLFGKGAKARSLKNKFEGLHVQDFTPHDLRRTCRTLLSKCKVSSDVAEKYLGHKLKGVVEIYNQDDFFEERREAMELLSSLIVPFINSNSGLQ